MAYTQQRRRIPRGLWAGLALAAGVWLLAPGCDADPTPAAATRDAVPIVAVPGTHLQNLHRLTATVYAGAQPEDADAFADLQQLGIRTVISVDGATPDQAAAERVGLRYIHLPIGYDGVPVKMQEAIAKAIVEAEGGVYIHCHHGQHRGAAAAAAACVVAGLIDTDHAIQALKQMQTGENYLGLWRDVRAARPVAAADLHALQVVYRPAQPIPPLAHAMVGVDETNELIKLCRKAGWKTPPGHPDLDPPHEALQLREYFAEIRRTPDCAARPADFQAWAQATEAAAAELETALRTPQPLAAADRAWDQLQAGCLQCHTKYRNGPRGP